MYLNLNSHKLIPLQKDFTPNGVYDKRYLRTGLQGRRMAFTFNCQFAHKTWPLLWLSKLFIYVYSYIEKVLFFFFYGTYGLLSICAFDWSDGDEIDDVDDESLLSINVPFDALFFALDYVHRRKCGFAENLCFSANDIRNWYIGHRITSTMQSAVWRRPTSWNVFVMCAICTCSAGLMSKIRPKIISANGCVRIFLLLQISFYLWHCCLMRTLLIDFG